jgi:lipid-A-disaccharide synthase
MRYFFSTGEASGELVATLLAAAIARRDPEAVFEGIGHDRMRRAGFRLWRESAGWAAVGPFAAIPRIPPLLVAAQMAALHLARSKPDAVVLVDFGAFNVRLAQWSRARGFGGPIVDVFPPSAWLDRERAARAVSAVAIPVTAFEHQRDFYRSLGLRVEYFGHPLAAAYTPRALKEPPLQDGGTVAILPGSRASELRMHLPAVIGAYKMLKSRRPQIRAIFGAADAHAARRIGATIAREGLDGVRVAAGTAAAIAPADAAWVASGTAVLECVLSGVPVVAFYRVGPLLYRHARRLYSGTFITVPNLVLGRAVIPELLQDDAVPARLSAAMDALLHDPHAQTQHFAELRAALGPPNGLERCAQFVVDLARARA